MNAQQNIDRPKLQWIGDNFGATDAVVVVAKSHSGTIYLDEVETMMLIDDFDDAGRSRILSGMRSK